MGNNWENHGLRDNKNRKAWEKSPWFLVKIFPEKPIH